MAGSNNNLFPLCTWVYIALVLSLSITCYGAAIPTDLAIRSDGDITVFDERSNSWVVGIGMTLITATASVIAGTGACATAPWTVPSPTCFKLVASFVGSALIAGIGYLIPGGTVVSGDVFSRKQFGQQIVYHSDWHDNYQATGLPVIMQHHDCYGTGCLQTEYSLHLTKEGRAVHRLLTGPRRADNGSNHLTSLERRQGYQQAYQSYDSSYDGDEYYIDYFFELANQGPAQAIVNSFNADQNGFDHALGGATDPDGLIENNGQGYYCYNIGNPSESQGETGLATVGYAGFFVNTMEQDPDDEDSYIQNCAGQGQTSDYYEYTSDF